MKKLSLLLVFVLLIASVPVISVSAEAGDVRVVEVLNNETIIEFEDFYQDYPATILENANVSGGKIVDCWYGIGVSKDASISFEINLARSGKFDIDYAVGYLDNNSCPLEILIDGVSIGQNGAGAVKDLSQGTLFPRPTNPLKLYRKYGYELSEGNHTVTLQVTKAGDGYKFAADYISFIPWSRNVSAYSDTTVELDQYYRRYTSYDWKSAIMDEELASGGKLVDIYVSSRQGEYIGAGLWVKDETRTTPVFTTTFDVYAQQAGNYKLEWVVGPDTQGACKSRVSLDLNGSTMIDTSSDTYDSDPFPSNDIPRLHTDMKLYNADVELKKGTNTIDISVYGDSSYNTVCFATDYVKFIPLDEYETPTHNSAYIVQDFEDGFVNNIDAGIYPMADGPGAAKYAVKVPDGSAVPEFNFGLRSKPTFSDASWSYGASLWVKADAPVTTDTVSLVFTMGNTSYDGSDESVPRTLEKTVTVSNAGLKQGEWVKVTVPDFTYDGKVSYDGTSYATDTNGSVKVVLGDNIAYTLDDLVVIPNKYTPVQGVTENSALKYQFEQITTQMGLGGYYKWTVSPDLSDYTFESYSGISAVLNGNITVDGESIKVKNLLKMKNLANHADITYTGPDLKFGATYTYEFYAKADNDAATNIIPTVILSWPFTDTKNITYSQNIEYKASTNAADGANGTKLLKDTWKKYSVTFSLDCVTNDETPPYALIVRPVDPSGASVVGAEWSFTGGKVYQSDSGEYPNLKPYVVFEDKKVGDGVVSLEAETSVTNGQVSNTISRILVPYNGDYVIGKSFDDWKNEESYIYEGADFADAKISVIATDKHDYFGDEVIRSLEHSKSDFTAVVEFDQTIWAKDMPTLSATVRYKNAQENDTLLAICAQYGPNNQMISCDRKPIVLSAGEHEAKLTLTTTPEAEKAKIFLWKEASLAPKREDVVELTKTTDGTFIYVDPVNGKANTTYGYKNPLKTVEQAVSATGSIITSSGVTDVYVILLPGDHRTSGITITQAMTDASKNVTFMSYDKNDKSVISGGVDISGGFTAYKNGIYRKQIAVGTQSRELYVNGVKATKARSRDLAPNEFTNTTTYSNGWLGTLGDLKTSSSEWVSIANYQRIQDLEFVFLKYWSTPRCQASSVVKNSDGSINIKFTDDSWKWANSTLHSHVTTPLYMENALELLDEPGEWYLDSTGGYIYYMPRENENIATAEVILPMVDNYKKPLVDIVGTSAEAVSNVTFRGIEFAHTTWTRPNTTMGMIDFQNHVLYDFNPNSNGGADRARGRIAEGAIDLTYTDNVDFNNCVFTKMGSIGIRLYKNVKNSDLIGNEIYEISAGAIAIGENDNGTNNMRTASNITDINILNNYIHNVSEDYWECAAITVFFPQNTTIANNEICYFPYSGFHIGWGWATTSENSLKNFKVMNNYIHDLFQGYMYDGGAIYTLGKTNDTPGVERSVISGNYIEDVGTKGAYIYNDDGSANYLVENNVMDARNTWGSYDLAGTWHNPSRTQNLNMVNNSYASYMIWRNNYHTNSYHRVNVEASADATNEIETPILLEGATGMWPAEVLAIMENAGIQDEYKGNFRYRLQEIKATETLTMNVGDSITGTPELLTGKNTAYSSAGLSYTITSSNEKVIAVSGNTITAVKKGTAIVTYTAIENGMVKQASTEVAVE